jgi:hypothetical protein
MVKKSDKSSKSDEADIHGFFVGGVEVCCTTSCWILSAQLGSYWGLLH